MVTDAKSELQGEKIANMQEMISSFEHLALLEKFKATIMMGFENGLLTGQQAVEWIGKIQVRRFESLSQFIPTIENAALLERFRGIVLDDFSSEMLTGKQANELITLIQNLRYEKFNQIISSLVISSSIDEELIKRFKGIVLDDYSSGMLTAEQANKLLTQLKDRLGDM